MTHASFFPLRGRLAGSAVWLALLVAAGTSVAMAETRILALAYSGPFALDPNIHNLGSNLLGPGYSVTFDWSADFGDLATALGQASYDQIWIWDQMIGPAAHLTAADKAALSTWYAAHPNIALDSRALAIRMENDATETQLAHNIRDQFAAVGGGLWLGGTQAPTYCATANSWLSYAQSGLYTGSWEGMGALTGVAGHPFLADLDVQGLRYGAGARSAAPTTGPGGVPLQAVVRDHLGNPILTTNIPEPAAFVLLAGGGLLAVRSYRARRSALPGGRAQ